MENVRSKRWALLPLVFACATVGLMVADEAAAQNNSSPSWWSFGESKTPPPSEADDPTSLHSKHEAGAELYVAVARLYVVGGKFTEAEEQYQQALKKFPNDIRVLLGYAMLKDQMNQPQEALKFYQQAEKKHPKQPAVYNDLAVHYVRQGMLREAIEASQRAIELRPHEPRYRNNLAAILVEAGTPQEAFKQLREVYDEPVAHYDLGFLLNKRGMKAAALQEFTIALKLSPRMTLAREWVQRLSAERGEGNPAVVGVMPPQGQAPAAVVPNPAFQRESLPPPPLAPSPPLLVAPPQYVAPQYPSPAQPPAQVQYPVRSPAPAQVPYPAQGQYPAQVQYPVPPQNPPQYQNPALPPAVNPMPVVASRDPQATGVRVIPAPAADGGNNLRRLPPVADPQNAADPNRNPQQGPELVAPDPPGWRR